MTSWLSTMTSSGRLYEIDLRLRPDGDAGLLAVSVEAFEQYQRKHAWSWEHQALTRARHAAGDAAVGERFERIRADILVQPRDPAALRQEVLEMRGKINSGHPNATPNFDLKHDAGGMVDVEFVTQYLVLCHSGSHPVLVRNLGNIALLRLAGEAGLIPTDLALQAGDAYRTLRRVQHQMRLQGVERPASRPTSCRPSGPPCANSGRRCWAEPSGAGGSAARLAPTRRKIRVFPAAPTVFPVLSAMSELVRPKLDLPAGRSKVLMHSCCAPCSGEVMEAMTASGIDYAIYFYNPNIHPVKEYEIRKQENIRYAEQHGIEFIDADYDMDNWFDRVKGLEDSPSAASAARSASTCASSAPRCTRTSTASTPSPARWASRAGRT